MMANVMIIWDKHPNLSKYTVVIDRPGRHAYYEKVSPASIDRISQWLKTQYPNVYGGGNYYGGSYEIKERDSQ